MHFLCIEALGVDILRVLEPLVKFALSLAGKSEVRVIIVTVTASRGGTGGRDSNGRRDG
jgi:hypothetical protein